MKPIKIKTEKTRGSVVDKSIFKHSVTVVKKFTPRIFEITVNDVPYKFQLRPGDATIMPVIVDGKPHLRVGNIDTKRTRRVMPIKKR